MSPRREPRPGVRLGSPFGIPLYAAPSWFVVAALLTVLFVPSVQQLRAGTSQGVAVAVSVAFVLLLYGSVVVHELSHALVARGLGLPVRRIRIYLLGGVSELEREPETPAREYLVAMAGPLLSLLLAGVGAAVTEAVGRSTLAGLIIGEVAVANGVVALFNLLPGLPLDGGRVLRAAVWQVTRDPLTGLSGAAWGGRALGLLVAGGPLLYLLATPPGAVGRPDPVSVLWFAVVGSFLWQQASLTLRVVTVRRRAPALSAARLARPALAVPPDLPLAEALRRAQAADARAVVVVDGRGEPSMVVSEAAVAATPEERRPWTAVSALARGLAPELVVPATLTGDEVLARLAATPASEYVVVDADGRLVGVLVTADVAAAVTR